ncbi:MAG: OmpA family protein [Saprospiraceae bacterium]|nr:OmpA family protein [Saprospiraceae bacterium]
MKHILLLILLPLAVLSQNGNLVLNPGFEKLKPKADLPICMYGKNAEHFESILQNWMSFGGMTPDLIIWKPDAYGDCFLPKPHSGENSVGIITYGYREMIQSQLRAPLVPGKKYIIELYVNLSEETALHHYQSIYGEKRDIRPTAAGNLGFHFSYNKVWDWGQIQPQVVWAEPIVTKKDEWKLVSSTFIADKAYMFFTIGNFDKDENTQTTLKDLAAIEAFNAQEPDFTKRIHTAAYYCIDDIRIVPADAPPPATDISTALKTKKTYTFRNVNFETGKWDILPPALPELDNLAAFLKENPKLKAEIGGHTDDVGEEDDNQLLSQNRAEAVANYLISKGIVAGRITFKGYGESQPIVPNTSAAGRLQNRRVECKVL